MKFEKRLTAPMQTNKYYVKTTHGGYNRCILIKDNGCVLPNCVGYAWGRFCEEQKFKDCRLSRGNAKTWYGNTNDDYKRGTEPKLGSVLCYTNDKRGHVAIVEDILKDKSIIISESAYNGFYFRTQKVSYPYKKTGYTFQGFIYPVIDFEGDNMFNIGDVVECIKDTKLYTTIEEKESKYTIKKGDIAYVKFLYGNSYIALGDVESQKYFPSAWTKELNNFKLYEVDYQKLYEEEVEKNKELESRINKAIEVLNG